MKCGVFCCVCICLCLHLSLYGREVTFGYARVREGTGAIFCYLAALRSAIEFLFWDHWETAVLGQILAGEVTGGHGRLRAVAGGYGGGKQRKVEERQEKGRRKPQKMTEISSVTE